MWQTLNKRTLLPHIAHTAA